MTTFLMFVFVLAIALGAVILGWLIRARTLGLPNVTHSIDRGEVGGTQNGD